MRFVTISRNTLSKVLCGLLVASTIPLELRAEPTESSEARSTEANTEPQTVLNWDPVKAEQRNVRLNFVSTTWPTVLKGLAEKSGSTLVMHDTPPGRFSRQDWNRYDRADAVRILNRELDAIGFRIIEKDQFLTVMQVRRARAEYQRPEAPAAPATQMANVPQTLPMQTTKPLGQVQKISTEVPRNSDIRQAAYQAESPASAAMIIQPKHRKAIEIAKQVNTAFKNRSRLEDAGPNGMPAFVVDQFANDAAVGTPLFTIEIDMSKNELLITATPQVQAGLRTLINQIDVNPLEDEQVPTLVAGDGTLVETGKKLQLPLSKIAQTRKPFIQQAQAEDANAGNQLVPSEGAQDANQFVPEGAMIAGKSADGLPSLIGNLKGDVTIEALDDLDLLILRGNEKDIEAVMQVIQAVEQMAIGSLPEIHLLNLQHVNSESLALLLNDVYSKLSELRSNNAQQSATAVQVVPVVKPNAVLILAPANTMPAILDLADELDQPVDPTHEVQVFQLKHAVASSVVTTLQEFYGDENVGLGTRLKISADSRTNSIIIQARPSDLTEISTLIKKIDADEAGSVAQLKIFPLKSATSDELATFLNSAVQSVSDPAASTVAQNATRNTNNQANQEAKSVVLEFLAEDGQKLLRSGLLTDIRFNSDPRTNSLMVTAPEQSMPLIGELINILDRPSTAISEIKVFQLENADAADAVVLLDELFGQQNTQSNNTGNNGSTGTLGIDLVGAQGSINNLIPLRFSVDVRSNSVVVVGGADALRIVEAVLLRLDNNDGRNRKTTVIKLRNSPAADVATAINQFLQSQRDLATLDPERISTSQLLEQEVIVTPETISNSLIISATPAYFDSIQELTRQLDAEPSQVLIQALLVEVELNNTDEFGVELGFQDSVLFKRGILGDVVNVTQSIVNGGTTTTTTATATTQRPANPGFDFPNNPLGQNVVSPSTVGSQGLSNFALSRVNNDLGYGGLVLSASSESVNVLIRALAARRTLRILSRPQILALDNQLAQIQVGQIVPVTDGVTITNNNVTPLITRDPAGIILTVTPRISPEGQIVMEVVAEKSEYTAEGVTVFTDAATGNEVTSPIKNITTALTTVKVPDGQTIVVGGMITKSDDNIERKVPWLGDLPIIGHAFRFDTHDHRRTELLIFLTPRIVHNSTDTEAFKQIEAQRLHYFETEAEEVHGPLFGVPNEMAMPIDGYPVESYPGEMYPGESFPTNEVPTEPGPHLYDQDTVHEKDTVQEQNTVPPEPEIQLMSHQTNLVGDATGKPGTQATPSTKKKLNIKEMLSR